MSSIGEGKDPEIRNPKGANDFIYIDDVARALVSLVEHKPKSANEVYNVGSGVLTSVADVVKEVYLTVKKKPPAFPKIKKPEGFWADITKIERDTGWRPKVTIKEGIRKTVKNLQS